jgi:hypothetical protein
MTLGDEILRLPPAFSCHTYTSTFYYFKLKHVATYEKKKHEAKI